MVKLVAGSFLFIAGLFSTMTIAFSFIGIPMMLGGAGMAVAGFFSMTSTAVKAGVATGKVVKEIRNRRDGGGDSAPVAALAATPQGSIADEIAKLGQLRDLGHLTQDEFDQQKALLLKGRA